MADPMQYMHVLLDDAARVRGVTGFVALMEVEGAGKRNGIALDLDLRKVDHVDEKWHGTVPKLVMTEGELAELVHGLLVVGVDTFGPSYMAALTILQNEYFEDAAAQPAEPNHKSHPTGMYL